MTATNHVLTGAFIGLTLHQPVAAIGLSFISHFMLDALPHYGDENHTQKKFITVLFGDMFLASLVLLAFALTRPINWQIAVICAVIAASPDLMWLPMWIRELKHLPPKSEGLIKRFHKNIQWAETAGNYPLEIIWALSVSAVLFSTITK